MKTVTKEMIINQVLQLDNGVVPILLQSGLHCLGCPHSQMESLEAAGMVHGIDVDKLVEDLNEYLAAVE